jgi:hypothetical protein
LFGIVGFTDFMLYTPANEEDVEACSDGKGSGPGQDMRLDFGKGFSSSRWNRLILQRIYNDIVAIRNEHGGWGLPDVSEGYLIGELAGQLKRSQEAWSLVQPRFLAENDAMERPDEVTKRVDTYWTKRIGDVSSRSIRKRVSSFYMNSF